VVKSSPESGPDQVETSIDSPYNIVQPNDFDVQDNTASGAVAQDDSLNLSRKQKINQEK